MLKKHTDDRKKLIWIASLVFILCFFVLKSNAQGIAGFRFVHPGLPDRAGFFLHDSKNYLWLGTCARPNGDGSSKLKDKSASEIHKSISDNNLGSSGSNLQGENTEAITKEPSQYDNLTVLLNTIKTIV